jgi:hypothetical protein
MHRGAPERIRTSRPDSFFIRQLTDVSGCNLQQYFPCNRHPEPDPLECPARHGAKTPPHRPITLRHVKITEGRGRANRMDMSRHETSAAFIWKGSMMRDTWT